MNKIANVFQEGRFVKVYCDGESTILPALCSEQYFEDMKHLTVIQCKIYKS